MFSGSAFARDLEQVKAPVPPFLEMKKGRHSKGVRSLKLLCKYKSVTSTPSRRFCKTLKKMISAPSSAIPTVQKHEKGCFVGLIAYGFASGCPRLPRAPHSPLAEGIS